MGVQTGPDPSADETWRQFLESGVHTGYWHYRPLVMILPAGTRCKLCHAPLDGFGGRIVRVLFDRRPSKLNPRLCSECDNFAHKHQGGAEVELTTLFADVRGSTTLAEKMSPAAFSQLINRFYTIASKILIDSDAMIDKIIGDQVAGMYVPGLAGPDHARRAVDAAREILRATGHQNHGSPWIPLGVGVHTGIAYVGAVGSKDGTSDITVLGDAANTAARLSSNAGPGEILVSQPALAAARLPADSLEQRLLALKGKSEPVAVHVMRLAT